MPRLHRAAVLFLVLLALAWGRQEAVDMGGDGPAWRPRNTYPTRAADWLSPPAPTSLGAPALCVLPDGRGMLACLETEPCQGDRLRTWLLRPGEPDQPQDAGVVPDTGPRLLAPRLAPDPAGRPWLTWIALIDGRGVLQGATWTEEGWSAPRTVVETTGPVVAHDLLRRRDGSVALAWQEHAPADEPGARGRYHVRARAARADGTWGPPVDLSADHRLDDGAPVLAESDDGTLWAVFVRDHGGDREVTARRLDPDAGSAGPAINLSDDSWADDLHPHAVGGAGGRLWVTFDSVQMAGRGASTAFLEEPALVNRNRVRLVALEQGRVRVVSGAEQSRGAVPTEAPLSQSGGHPRLVRADDGTLHLLHRAHATTRRRTFDYPLLHLALGGDGWRPAELLDGAHGATTAAALARGPAGWWLAWECQVGAAPYPDADQLSQLAGAQVCLTGPLAPARVAVGWQPAAEGSTPAPGLADPAPWERPARPQPLPDPATDPITLGDRHHRIRQGDTTWTVYWGDLHRHSNVSPCTNGFEPGPEDRYRSARQVARNDFFALTDHTSDMTPEEWWHGSKLVDLYQAPDFVTLQGYEWNSPEEGHVNVILRQRSDAILCNSHPRGRTLDALGRNLDPRDALTIPHTTASQALTVDWRAYPQALLRVVEVYQAQRGSYESGGCYLQARNAIRDGSFVQDGLQAGRVFGLIASTDHGNGAAYTAVLARELSRDAVFEALQARRTYAATSKGMLLDFRVAGRLMGQRVEADGPVEVEVRVEGTAELAELVVFRDGEVWRAEGRAGRAPDAEGVLTLELALPEDPGPLRGRAIRLTLPERGRFSRAARGRLAEHDPERPAPAWRALDRRAVVFHVGPRPSNVLARRIRVHGTDDSPVEVQVGDGAPRRTTLGELRQGPWSWPEADLELRPYGLADAEVDPGRGMGTDTWTSRYQDPDPPVGGSWYYLRVIQTDGEAAWSSPVFVERGRTP